MEMTRRQFGFAILGGITAFLLGPILRLFGPKGGAGGALARARFWSRADHLAG